METNIIGIRELHRRLREISDDTLSGRSFIVVRNTKPVFRIEPYKEEKKYSLEDFKKISRKSGKKLSLDIDKIITALEKEDKDFLSLVSSSPSYGKLKNEEDEDEKLYSLSDAKPIN